MTAPGMFTPEQLRQMQRELSSRVDEPLVLEIPPSIRPHCDRPPDKEREAVPCGAVGGVVYFLSPHSMAVMYALSGGTLLACAYNHLLAPLALAFPILVVVSFLDVCVARGGAGERGCGVGLLLWCTWVASLAYAVGLSSVRVGVVSCVLLSILQAVLAAREGAGHVYAFMLTLVGCAGTGAAAVAYFAVSPREACLYVACACVSIQCVCTVVLSRGVHLTVGGPKP